MTIATELVQAVALGTWGDQVPQDFETINASVLASQIPAFKFEQVAAHVIGGTSQAGREVEQVFAMFLCTLTTTFEYTAVVFSDVFPYDISYNSVGSTRFATDVIIVDSGDDQRIQRWSQPLMEYDIAYGVRTMEQLIALIAFFRAMKGRLNAFCYQDNSDYTSSIPVAYESRSAPPITDVDQNIGVGDGMTFAFQLTKTYSTTTQSQIRPITRPMPGTTIIALNGVSYGFFSVDVTTGIVTFTPPAEAIVAGACAKTAASGSGGNATFTAATGAFNNLKPFVGRPCYITGWATPLDNFPLTSTLPQAIIEAVASDGSTVTITYPAGWGTTVESGVTGITVFVHPAPLNTVVVTAGFEFYVPVRFDTDILPVQIEDYGVGGANSVKLIEVRPGSQTG